MSRWLVACLVTIPGLLVAQRDLKQIPDPDPQKELASFQVHPDCRVNLFVSDPAIAKPIQMNFDAEGRLWIASSEVYPQIKPGEKPTDKILVVEDKDGDGKADLTRVFADGLLIPTGVLPGDGGVYVVNSTELLHLSDTDGDGISDFDEDADGDSMSNGEELAEGLDPLNEDDCPDWYCGSNPGLKLMLILNARDDAEDEGSGEGDDD